MKIQNLYTLGICLLLSCYVFGQDTDDKSIIGTWVSESDNTWKLVFASDGKCQQYSENNLSGTDSYTLSNTTPQCGEDVVVDDKSLFLSLKDLSTGDELCYYVNGITDRTLSLNYFNGGSVLVFLRSQTGIVTMQSGFSNIASTVSNEGTDVSLKLLFYPSSIMSAGKSYLIGNISKNMRPEMTQKLSAKINSRAWVITINSDGNVFCKIAGRSGQSAGQNVDLETLKYQLYDPANQ